MRSHRVLVAAEHAHDALAGAAEVALEAADAHRVDEHAREAKGDLLGELVAVQRHLEAVAEVDVQDLARVAVQHQVGRVAVAEPEDVADHRHDRERARVVGAPEQPVLGVARAQPEHLRA